MKDGNAIQRITILVTFGVLSLTAAMAIGQELPYTEGSVWSISMIRVKPGMFEVYMREVLPARKKTFDEAKKQFLCPCHNSVFAIDGNVVAGPAPRPLDRFEAKVQNNKLLLGEIRESKETTG